MDMKRKCQVPSCWWVGGKDKHIVITSIISLVRSYNASINHDGNEGRIPNWRWFWSDLYWKCRGFLPCPWDSAGLWCVVSHSQPSFKEVRKIIRKQSKYQEGLFDELYVCCNHPSNSLTSKMQVEQMLPIIDLDFNGSRWGYVLNLELESSRDAILDQLLPPICESMIYSTYYWC